MAVIYTTKDGDVLDQICWQYYGKTDDVVEQVMKENPHLAKLDVVFVAGVKIVLGDIIIQKQNEAIKLWS